MDFVSALRYSYQNRRSDEEFANPFFLYCKLSDLCSSTFEVKHKVVVFYQIDKKINVVKSILSRDFDVRKKYAEVAELLTERSFLELVDIVKEIIGQERKIEEIKVAKAVITSATQTEQEETRTPLDSYNSTSTYYGGWDNEYLGCGIFGVVLLALLSALAFIFDWKWMVWQWLLGIGGGAGLFLITIALVGWLDDEAVVDFYVLGTILLGISVLLNFILLLIFGANYKVLFGCLSVFELIGGLILVYPTFDDLEEEWGAVQIVEMCVAVVLMLVGVIWL